MGKLLKKNVCCLLEGIRIDSWAFLCYNKLLPYAVEREDQNVYPFKEGTMKCPKCAGKLVLMAKQGHAALVMCHDCGQGYALALKKKGKVKDDSK